MTFRKDIDNYENSNATGRIGQGHTIPAFAQPSCMELQRGHSHIEKNSYYRAVTAGCSEWSAMCRCQTECQAQKPSEDVVYRIF